MKKPCNKILKYLCWLMLLCAPLSITSCYVMPVDNNSFQNDTMNMAQRGLAEIRAKGSDGFGVCMFGVEHEENLVWGVSSIAEKAGMMPGDIIVEVNDISVHKWQDITNLTKDFKVGDNIKFAINRQGVRKIIQMTCHDRRPIIDSIVSIYNSMADGNWKQCIRQTYELGRIGKYTSLGEMRLRVACNEALRLSENRLPNYSDAEMIYSYNKRMIETQKFVPRSLKKRKGYILGTINWLNENRFEYLADDLKTQLEVALNVQSSRRVPKIVSKTSYGTCFSVTPDGLILTNHHVIKNSKSITVYLSDGRKLPAKIEQDAASVDLALLRVNAHTKNYLSIAPIRSARVGDKVFTFGYPVTSLLGNESKFTEGSISSLSGIGGAASFMQISVPIQPGNSGGPLVNYNGQVVGITTATAAIVPFIGSSAEFVG